MAPNGKRAKQFYNNLQDILGGYENGRIDYGEDEYPNMTADKWIEYVMSDMYHMKADGYGTVWYGTNICGDLRFLGNRFMHQAIIDEVRKEGWLIE